MIFIKNHLKLFALLCCMLFSLTLQAATNKDILRLEDEMLKYIDSDERDTFISVTDQLKKACKEAGDERLFYKAWGNQGIYEATHQYYDIALDIAKAIMDYAMEEGSIYGEYAAMHTEAMILLQKQDYEAAEKTFLKAVDFHHRHFPNESAGADLQELMKIANHRKDAKAGENYARQIVNEPNVAPIHKGRALYRLSQMAFKKNDTEEFNRIYQEMMLLKQSDGISALKPLVEVNHYIINGEFDKALHFSEELDPMDRAERKAVIYHRMGDDANAFKYMQIYKQVSDSITLVSHGNIVASCYVQMNNDRMQLEQVLLERENSQLRYHLYLAVGALVLFILLFLIFRARQAINSLKKHNKMLMSEKKDTERALSDLNELSSYEGKTEIPLTLPLKPNEMCNQLTVAAQARCHKGVSVVFQTELPDDYELTTNPEALKKLLIHLLNYSARFTNKGTIVLSCGRVGKNLRFSVTDPDTGHGGRLSGGLMGMFAEHNEKKRYASMNFNVCQFVTRLLHGYIWHDVEYDNGTRFCVEIPINP